MLPETPVIELPNYLLKLHVTAPDIEKGRSNSEESDKFLKLNDPVLTSNLPCYFAADVLK